MKIIIRHLLEAVLNPFVITLAVFLVLLILLIYKGYTPIIRNGLIVVFVLLLLMSTGWLPKALTRHLESQYPVVTQADPTVHWIVVLGGGMTERPNIPPNAILGPVSLDRLIEGVRLYRQLPAAKLLLSGRGYDSTVPEAKRLSEVVTWFDIPASNIVLETISDNTAEEARAIKPMVKEEPFYLVTSAIHMPRAMALFKAHGLHPIAAPTDFTFYRGEQHKEGAWLPKPVNLYHLTVALHEVAGNLRNYFLYWTKN